MVNENDRRMCAVEHARDSLMASLNNGSVAEHHTSHDDVELEVLEVEAESLDDELDDTLDDELDDALEDELDDDPDDELDLLSVL